MIIEDRWAWDDHWRQMGTGICLGICRGE